MACSIVGHRETGNEVYDFVLRVCREVAVAGAEPIPLMPRYRDIMSCKGS